VQAGHSSGASGGAHEQPVRHSAIIARNLASSTTLTSSV
jgi:hypothetical protein